MTGLDIFIYYHMSVLDNNVGTIYETVGDHYLTQCHTFPENAVQQVVGMLRAQKFPIEDMPGIFELYRMIQDELLQYGVHSSLDYPATGAPDKDYMGPKFIPGPYLKITDKLGMNLGYISITNK